jgi:hypothetical protein
MLAVLTLSAGITACSCRANVSVALLVLAVRVAVCSAPTADTAAAKVALVAPAATGTVAGTVTAESLLARFTVSPELPAAALSVTVQLSDAEPMMELFVQLKELSVPVGGAVVPVPLRSTTTDASPEALLAISSVPVAVPAVMGSNCTLKLTVLLGFTVTGRLLWPLAEKDCPLTLTCEIVTDAFVLADCPTGTTPNVTELVETVRLPTVIPPVLLNEERGATQPERKTADERAASSPARRQRCLAFALKVGHKELHDRT